MIFQTRLTLLLFNGPLNCHVKWKMREKLSKKLKQYRKELLRMLDSQNKYESLFLLV